MAAILFHEPVFSTQVESGDKLYFYEVGTTTDLTVYTDFELTTAATQPVVADSSGRFAPLYIDGTGNDPKIVLHDSSDVEKWTCDRYPIDDLSQLQVDLDAAEAAIVVNQGAIATAEADIDALELESVDYESRITALESVTGAVLDSDFTGANQDLAEDGYQIFPGGLIEQWGKTSSIAAHTTITVTLPTPFPTAFYNVVASSAETDVVQDGAWAAYPNGLTQIKIVNTRAGAIDGIYWQAKGK